MQTTKFDVMMKTPIDGVRPALADVIRPADLSMMAGAITADMRAACAKAWLEGWNARCESTYAYNPYGNRR